MTRQRLSRGGSRTLVAAALLLLAPLLAALAGCVTVDVPITPYPEVAHVPHPLALDDERSMEELQELYSTSPARNPDGLGALDVFWLNSRMTLVTWPFVRKMEERNKLAYARTDAEQAQALEQAHDRYGKHWVFEGIVLGRHLRPLGVDFYQPEGIYAVDDRGRKFLPITVGDADPILFPRRDGVEGSVYYSYPRLVFPAEMITRETRAISLYLAAVFKRARFAWVFDPAYEMPGRSLSPESGRGRNRLFPAQ